MFSRQANKPGYLLPLVIPLLIALGLLVYWTGYNMGFDHDDPLSNSTDETLIYQESFSMYEDSGVQRRLQGYPPEILWLLRAAQRLTPHPQQPHPLEAVAYIRLCNGIFNVLTLIALVLIGRRLYSDMVGVIAACAWLFAPLIVSRVDVALTEPGQALFIILALYFSIEAIDRDSAGAALLSILAALVAVLFKYSAFSALGFGIGAALWHWRKNHQKWSLILALQAACIAVVAALLLGVYGAAALSDNPEGAAFLQGGVRQITFSLFSRAFEAASQQIGWNVIILLLVYGLGTILYLRSHSQSHRYIWLMMSIFVLAYLLIMLTYLVFWIGAQRYIAPITPVLVLLMSISLVQAATFVAQRVNVSAKFWQPVVAALCAAVWLGPLAAQTLADLPERSQPNPAYAPVHQMVDWSARALPQGTIRIPNRSGLWSFFDTWWGYTGPQRPWIYAATALPNVPRKHGALSMSVTCI